MREIILNQINNALHEHQGFFHSEKEIQIFLAEYFRGSSLYENVFLEYYVGINQLPNYPWGNDNKISIDIVLKNENQYYPIEIKFKTATQILPHFVFDTETHVTLENHGAQTIGRYDFWKDIKRLELFEETFENVQRGIMLFVSNDPSYRQPPRNNDIGGAPFSIYQGRQVNANTFLNWNQELSVSNGRPGFLLTHGYMINWSPMIIDNHYYILI